MKYFVVVWLISVGISAHTQDRIITGRIVNKSTQVALRNVNIVVQGTTSGAVSNARGFFQIKLKSNFKSLVLSHVGYQEISIIIPEVNNFKIEMEPIFAVMPKVDLSTRPPELALYKQDTINITKRTFLDVQENATFIGGVEYLNNFLTTNFKYPDSLNLAIRGSTYVIFEIDSKGAISKVKIQDDSLNKAMKNHLIILIESMPAWQPASQNGEPVSQQVIIPLEYGPVSEYFGDNYLAYHLGKSITYPAEALRLATEGAVFAYFSLNSSQGFTQLEILQGIGAGCDKMVYDAIKGIPKTELESLMIEVGDSVFVLPVDFRLDRSSNREDELLTSTDAVFLRPVEVIAYEITFIGGEYLSFIKPTSAFYSVEGALKHIENATELRMVDQQLTTVSTEVKHLRNLQLLYLQNNELESLPDELIRLHNLKELNASQNKLSALPIGISEMDQLKLLVLADNDFTDFPTTILRLKRLEVLDLSTNNLSNIPAGINNMKKLRILNLSNNNLQNLPDEFYKLNLQEINLQGNKLSKEVLEKVNYSFKNAKIIN